MTNQVFRLLGYYCLGFLLGMLITFLVATCAHAEVNKIDLDIVDAPGYKDRVVVQCYTNEGLRSLLVKKDQLESKAVEKWFEDKCTR